MAVVYLSIGSNVGDRRGNAERASEAIGGLEGVELLGKGGMYETAPVGKEDQPWFVNTAVSVRCSASPAALLKSLKAIEKEIGRTPGEKWGPRVIDIDIIFYDDMTMDTPELTIPHREAAARRFVLAPIADMDPELVHPVVGEKVSEMLKSLEGQKMRKLGQ